MGRISLAYINFICLGLINFPAQPMTAYALPWCSKKKSLLMLKQKLISPIKKQKLNSLLLSFWKKWPVMPKKICTTCQWGCRIGNIVQRCLQETWGGYFFHVQKNVSFYEKELRSLFENGSMDNGRMNARNETTSTTRQHVVNWPLCELFFFCE